MGDYAFPTLDFSVTLLDIRWVQSLLLSLLLPPEHKRELVVFSIIYSYSLRSYERNLVP